MFINNKQKIFIILITGLIIFGIKAGCSAADIPKIRELPSNPVSLNNRIIKTDKDNSLITKEIIKKSEKNLDITASKSTARLKGGIAELKTTVGKTQLIKFDEPIKRISVTDPSLVDIVMTSPKEMLLNGKAGGETSLIIWGESGDPVMFNLFVLNDSLNFIKEMKKITSDDDIKISFINSGGNAGMKVMITGHLSSTGTRKKITDLVTAYGYTLIDMTEALTPQIMLEVKIVEFTRSHGRTSGTNPTLYYNNVGEKINALSKLTYNLKSNADGTYSGVVDMPAANLQLALSQSESEGSAKILAEPRLMTVTDKAAKFTSSDNIPVITGRDEYGGLIVGSQSVGINLDVTPTILEESGRIILDITPNISSYADSKLAVDGFPVYIITQRQTHSIVEVEDKQTIVIGGLISKKTGLQKTNIPALFSHLPVIGNLLGSSTVSNSETELMIFVTPTIIKPDDVVNGV